MPPSEKPSEFHHDLPAQTWEDVLACRHWYSVQTGDALVQLKKMPDDSVDLVMCSPDYEGARDYGPPFVPLTGQAWVDRAVPIYLECVRVCRGLVAWVVQGPVKKFRWSATPALLMADLHRAGVKLRPPAYYHRIGSFGGGGKGHEFFRNDVEFIVCSSKGRLPHSDASITGGPPKYKPGGNPSRRKKDGSRVSGRPYTPPERANPGNVIEATYTADEVRAILASCGVSDDAMSSLIRCTVGGKQMGDALCHESEAPYSERLCEVMVRSFSREGDVVLDPFCGSGTTAKIAHQFMRRSVSFDLRESQARLTWRRVAPHLGVWHRLMLDRLAAGLPATLPEVQNGDQDGASAEAGKEAALVG